MNEKLKPFQKIFDEIKYLYGVEIKINSQFSYDKTGFYYENYDIKSLTFTVHDNRNTLIFKSYKKLTEYIFKKRYFVNC